MIIAIFILMCSLSLILGILLGWRGAHNLNNHFFGQLQLCVENRLRELDHNEEEITAFIEKVADDWLDIQTNPEKYQK